MNNVRYQASPFTDIGLIEAQYNNHSFKPHYHLDYHIGLISHGQQIFNYKGNKHQVGPGFIQVMMPDQVHDSQTIVEQGFTTRIFSISSNWFSNLVAEEQVLPLIQHCINDKLLYQQLMSLHCHLGEQKSAQLALDSFSLEVFSHLIQRYSDVELAPVYAIGAKHIYQLREYLMAHLAEKIHLSGLAKLCQLSESQLLRQFKRTMGITPYAWLARLRLEEALALLKAGQSSTQVSYQVGFYDQAHFVKAFIKAFGLTPSQVLGT